MPEGLAGREGLSFKVLTELVGKGVRTKFAPPRRTWSWSGGPSPPVWEVLGWGYGGLRPGSDAPDPHSSQCDSPASLE